MRQEMAALAEQLLHARELGDVGVAAQLEIELEEATQKLSNANSTIAKMRKSAQVCDVLLALLMQKIVCRFPVCALPLQCP